MRNNSDDVTTIPATPKRTPRATKLLQAAALAAMLVPLGAVAAEADGIQINCVSTGGSGAAGCGGIVGHYGGGENSNTWGFYTDSSYLTLIYTIRITGTPAQTFSLNVMDEVIHPEVGYYNPPIGVTQYSGWACAPTFTNPSSPDSYGACGLFAVDVSSRQNTGPLWVDGYDLYIKWAANGDPLSHPLLQSDVAILRSTTAYPNDSYNDALNTFYWDPGSGIPGQEPGIGGKGNGFSTFGVFTNPEPVPEPASLTLLATGLAGALVRTRRRKK